MTQTHDKPEGQEINQEKPAFDIVIQYVKDQSFENPNPIEAFLEEHKSQPAISLEIRTNFEKVREGLYEVLLHLNVKCTVDAQKTISIAELGYGAIVVIDEDQVPKESIGSLLMVYFPSLLFPFARAIIADMTREGGFPALMLNPIDFDAMYQEQLKNQPEAA